MNIEQLYEIFLRHPQVTTDSRHCPEGSIFFALKGDTFNGNRFAAAALQNGCSYAVIDEPYYSPPKLGGVPEGGEGVSEEAYVNGQWSMTNTSSWTMP